jgi:hypothetical protein
MKFDSLYGAALANSNFDREDPIIKFINQLKSQLNIQGWSSSSSISKIEENSLPNNKKKFKRQ